MESRILSSHRCRPLPRAGTSPPYPPRYRQRHGVRSTTINMTRGQDTSSDEEENIEVQELSYDDRQEPVEEQVLVEGDDYDVIQVFAVDPNLDLEGSSDEELEDFSISTYVPSKEPNESEYPNIGDNPHRKTIHEGIDGLNFNLDTPVVSNVDEYFIKEDKDILAVKDEPVVNDVDEYFIKETKPTVTNVDDFFIKEKVPDEEFPRPDNVDKFFVSDAKPPETNVEQNFTEQNVIEQNIDNTEVPINETDLEVLPNIEDLKRFLLEDMSHSNFKTAQRSYSLPQSPMRNICLDIDDAKTCLSFEDLNLDLSDLSFDNEKDKSSSSAKSDDVPRTLTDDDVNSFLISEKPKNVDVKALGPVIEDDLSHQDMEIEHPIESSIESVIVPPAETPVKAPITSTPTKSTVLNFCIEKTAVKKEIIDIKVEPDDFVDVESCNDTVIPVLAANNLSSLLEQFEATEKLNTKPKKVVKTEDRKMKSVSLTNGMRLQDAGVQLHKTKMRQILMPSSVEGRARRSPSPVHSDHDYCSSGKRYSLPGQPVRRGQSLLKPEVLSSNHRILSSRHRSCKNKKVDYALSSDDECDKNNKNKKSDDSDIKNKKLGVKQTAKAVTQPTRKKLSPVRSDNVFKDKDKINNSVIVKEAFKASDTPSSQNFNSSIKLTIKNKSEVILNCDVKDSQKDKSIEKCKSSVSEKTEAKKEIQNNIKHKSIKNIKEVDSNIKGVSIEKCTNVVKEEARPKAEHFYTALFSNKQDVQIPQVMQVKLEKRSFEEEISIATQPNKDPDQPQKKKKLNLHEYKMRRCVSSNNSSAAVSPEAIFPDMPHAINTDKVQKITAVSPPNDILHTAEQTKIDASKKIFDPIREASRKILMNTKLKQKAEATRKRDEDIVMSKIPKVENLQLQPLISDAEMMKIVGMANPETNPIPIVEKPQGPANIEEIVLVSIGVNTDEAVFKELAKAERVIKSQSPTVPKSHINFKIKKSDHVLKRNVFDSTRRDKKSPVDDKKPEMKIDKERFKGITATLKSVKKQVDTKISSNSLFASIQDVVKKKAPGEEKPERQNEKRTKSNSPKRKPFIKPVIVRDYDEKADHGEDKIILHLVKDRKKPDSTTMVVQTDPDPKYAAKTLTETKQDRPEKTPPTSTRQRTVSDMSMSSEDSLARRGSKAIEKPKERPARSQSKDKRSRSKERYDKYRRSRSRSRSRRRRRSLSRSRSRSRGRFRRYRRSDSPYRRKRRSRSRYRRRSPSSRREYRSNRSRSRNEDARSKSPRNRSPQRGERKPVKSLTPPLPRKQTISESSDSSYSSSSSSSSSERSRKSSGSRSLGGYTDGYRQSYRSPFSSEDRESNTPVEERRIVFVGRLEQDVTRSSLRAQFSRFGPVLEARLHSKEDGSRYGFVTYKLARDAWTAVESAGCFPQYDVGFGGRRAFCKHSYADLDGLEATYTESLFHGAPTPALAPARRDEHLSFEQMLHDMRTQLQRRKGDQAREDSTTHTHRLTDAHGQSQSRGIERRGGVGMTTTLKQWHSV